MAETSLTLLERLRQPTDASAWGRFVDLYTPLIQGWLRRQGVRPEDADDLVQEVFGVLLRELPRFQHNQRSGAFRCWLRLITVHRLRAFWKDRKRVRDDGADFERQLDELTDEGSGLSRLWDKEHDEHVLRRLLELTEPEFSSTTWQAFRSMALEGKRAADVAAELGTTVNVVLLAKSRVLRRLRQQARGLVD
jgi:RNA polymerase sigma-70 factor (ECF subfamily)